jgi:hypothetical protein
MSDCAGYRRPNVCKWQSGSCPLRWSHSQGLLQAQQRRTDIDALQLTVTTHDPCGFWPGRQLLEITKLKRRDDLSRGAK